MCLKKYSQHNTDQNNRNLLELTCFIRINSDGLSFPSLSPEYLPPTCPPPHLHLIPSSSSQLFYSLLQQQLSTVRDRAKLLEIGESALAPAGVSKAGFYTTRDSADHGAFHDPSVAKETEEAS
ncbi:hypothetical protein L3Q82_006610 [Scortum barcoo]|uniref:Uncharacterized protein n=1 Tax=Scortum barcoo TaxID=214431 RepID=A0ACB8X003_9TELE|nr:hypothetical protein L3Q82_006610 [Scortum barcoo]